MRVSRLVDNKTKLVLCVVTASLFSLSSGNAQADSPAQLFRSTPSSYMEHMTSKNTTKAYHLRRSPSAHLASVSKATITTSSNSPEDKLVAVQSQGKTVYNLFSSYGFAAAFQVDSNGHSSVIDPSEAIRLMNLQGVDYKKLNTVQARASIVWLPIVCAMVASVVWDLVTGASLKTITIDAFLAAVAPAALAPVGRMASKFASKLYVGFKKISKAKDADIAYAAGVTGRLEALTLREAAIQESQTISKVNNYLAKRYGVAKEQAAQWCVAPKSSIAGNVCRAKTSAAYQALRKGARHRLTVAMARATGDQVAGAWIVYMYGNCAGVLPKKWIAAFGFIPSQFGNHSMGRVLKSNCPI